MLEAGRVDEVIDRAESSRFSPRRKAARAYAEALARRGDTEKARSVLLLDYRKGGQVPSLVALADLERRLGLDGVALLHYDRAASLDRRSMLGRDDVCALFRQRARELLRLGEALAAEQDLSLARDLCGATRPATALRDQALARSIDEAAQVQVRERSANTTCPPGGCEAPPEADREAVVVAALERARADGPRALRRTAARLQTQLEPEDIVTLLLAEARGELGIDLLPDHEVRRWTGGEPWSEISPMVMSRGAAEAAWLQLRLSAVVEDMPIPPGPRVGPTMHDRWADRALELPGAQRWRISGWIGDLAGAELALAAEFRPRPTPDADEPPTEGAGASAHEGPADIELGPHTVTAPSHWAARVEPTPRSLEAMVLLARLREAAGQDDRALEILRFVLARAHQQGIGAASRLAVHEAARQLARGRPWHALAVADTLPLAAMKPALAAAASAIALDGVFCGGPCPDEPDRAGVQRVLGEDWVASMSAKVPALARMGQTRPRDAGNCPTLGERLGPDAVGPVTQALRRAGQSLEGPGLGDVLSRAIGSDLTLVCASRHVMPLMIAADTRISAAALSDALAHAPRMRAASMLRAHAELALLGGQEARAELLAVAAAGASRDPAATWAAIARRAHVIEAREVEMMALRETIMHTPGFDHEPARRALVQAALRDLERSALVRETEVGREAIEQHVSSYLDAYAPSQRWARREALARDVGRATWAAEIRSPLAQAMMPTPSIQARHPIGMAWLMGASPQGGQSLDGDALELAHARGRAVPLPVSLDVFADPAAFEAVRLELAAHARDWTLRRRTAIGLAVYATGPARAAAVVELERMIGDDEPRRAALHELLLARPAALEPSPRVGADSLPRATAIVEDDEALVRVVHGLDPAPAWFVGESLRREEVQ